MIHSVKARYIEKKMGEFYQKLTDGTIQNQKPDGQEIINSMKNEDFDRFTRAVIDSVHKKQGYDGQVPTQMA